MLVSPGSVSTTLAADFATSVAAATGDAHLGPPQRGSVVDPVAGHAGNVAGPLRPLDQPQLVLGQHPGKHVEVQGQVLSCTAGAGLFPQHRGRAGPGADPDLAGDGLSSGRGVTADHDHADAERAQPADESSGIRAGRIGQADQPRQLQPRPAGGDRQHAGTARRQGLDVFAHPWRIAGEGRDHRRGALDHPDLCPVSFDHGLRALVGRVERGECQAHRGCRWPAGSRRRQDRQVDRILSRLVGRRGGQGEHLWPSRVTIGMDCHHRKFVLGDGSGLVGAQQVHRRGFLDRWQAGDQHPGPGQLARPQRGREREGGGQRHRHRRDHQDEHKRQQPGQREMRDQPVGQDRHHQGAVHRQQSPYHPEDRLLQVADGPGGADQLRGPPVISGRPGRGDRAGCFPPAQQRPREKLLARPGLHLRRLAGEHRLVGGDGAAGDSHVRRDDVSEPDMYLVAGDELPGVHHLPAPVAADPGVYLQPLPQQGQRALGLALLRKAEHSIEHHQQGDDHRLRGLAGGDLQHHRRFQHPRHRPRQLAQQRPHPVRAFPADLVQPVPCEPGSSFPARQAAAIRGRQGGCPADLPRRRAGAGDCWGVVIRAHPHPQPRAVIRASIAQPSWASRRLPAGQQAAAVHRQWHLFHHAASPGRPAVQAVRLRWWGPFAPGLPPRTGPRLQPRRQAGWAGMPERLNDEPRPGRCC
jgi:hypothetical protein